MQKQTGLSASPAKSKSARFWHFFWQDRYMHLLLLPHDANRFDFTIKPFEIKTFLLKPSVNR